MILASLFLAAAAPQPTDTAAIVSSAMRAGTVGERYDGYLDFVGTPDDLLRRAVGEINIRRRTLYSDLAGRNRIAPREVGIATACKLLVRLPDGGAYQLADGAWRTIRADAPLRLPDYCPGRPSRGAGVP